MKSSETCSVCSNKSHMSQTINANPPIHYIKCHSDFSMWLFDAEHISLVANVTVYICMYCVQTWVVLKVRWWTILWLQYEPWNVTFTSVDHVDTCTMPAMCGQNLPPLIDSDYTVDEIPITSSFIIFCVQLQPCKIYTHTLRGHIAT